MQSNSNSAEPAPSIAQQKKQKLQSYQERKDSVKRVMNKYEWSRGLDVFLMHSVVRNYFNFEPVAKEVTDEAIRRKVNINYDDPYTEEKCRIRWSYLHLQRKIGKAVSYRSTSGGLGQDDDASGSGSDTGAQFGIGNKENHNTINFSHRQPKKKKREPRQKFVEPTVEQIIRKKDFSALTEKTTPKSLEEIEANMWKDNIKKGPRRKKDFLDVRNEDFSENRTMNVAGEYITPSNFNVLRDSLRQTSDKLMETLTQNLPDINLQESGTSQDEDEEVLPLDFRTALIESEGRVVIQAKPLTNKFELDDDPNLDNANAVDMAGLKGAGLDSFLESVRREPFREDEGAVNLDPDFNIEEKFRKALEEFDDEERINNHLHAPKRRIDATSKSKKLKFGQRKTYESDYSESDIEEQRKQAKALQRGGAITRTSFGGMRQPEKKVETIVKKEEPVVEEKPKKLSALQEIMRKSQQQRDELEKTADVFTNDDMLKDLEEVSKAMAENEPQSASEQSQGEFAPSSPYADAPTDEEERIAQAEEKKQAEIKRERQFLKAVQQVSSSETDEASASATSGSEMGGSRSGFGGAKRSTRKRPNAAAKPVTKEVLQPVKERSSKKTKVRYFKGLQVMSDTEGVSGMLSPSKHDMSDSDTSTARKKELDEEHRLPKNYQRVARMASPQVSSSEGSSADDDAEFEAQRAAARRGGGRISAIAAKQAAGKKTEAEKEAAFQKKLEQQRAAQREVIERRKREAELAKGRL